MGTPTNVLLGPGDIYVAPLGTAEPASASAALAAAWRAVGYTEEGNTFEYEIRTEPIEVAEEFDPVKIAMVGRSCSVTFSMAELTRQNLALALNMGAAEANDATSLEPPDPGAEIRIMLVFDAEESAARWIFRRAFSSDAIEIARKKAPDKALVPVKFALEKPTGAKLFKVFPGSDGRV
jgi:hypothetical protein